MMKLLVASLLALCTTAVDSSAQPSPPAPPPLATACAAPAGKIVFEIDSINGAGVTAQRDFIKLFENGTWTRHSPKVIPQVGCVDLAALKKLEKAIAKAPWTITHPQFRCMAKSQSFSEYHIGGIVYRSELCGNDILDAKSAAVLADAIALVNGPTATTKP